MVLVLAVLLVGMGVSLMRGGRFRNLSDVRIRQWWLLPVAFALQLAAEVVPDLAGWSREMALALVLGSYVPLLALVALNRTTPGMWLVGVGILMNFTVIVANGGMPVLSEAAYIAGGTNADPDIIASAKHVLLDTSTVLPFLGDVIPLRLFVYGQVISLGDVFLAVGLARVLEHELRQPVRWFKRGAPTEAGSAARR
jgi:hypothetical protein